MTVTALFAMCWTLQPGGGQPFRIRALRDFIRYAKQFDGVWFAKREDVAEWYLDHHLDHMEPKG